MPSISTLVLAEQARQLFKAALASNIVHIFIVGVFYLMLQDAFDSSLLFLWSIVSVCIAVSRLVLRHLYCIKNNRDAYFWLMSYALLSGLLGVSWAGFSLFYMMTDNVAIKSLMVVVSCGIMAAAAPILSAYLRAFYAFTLPLVLVLIGVLVHSGDASSYYIALAFIAYYLMLITVARNANQVLINTVQLQHSNDDLIATLNNEVAQRERLIEVRTQALVDANQHLQTNETLLQSIVEHSPVGIFYYDISSCLVTVNKRLEDILGSHRDVLLGFNMLESMKDEQMLRAVKQSLAGTASVFDGEYRSITGDKMMYLHADFVPMYSAHGEISGGIGVFEDITEAKDLSSKLPYQASHDALTGLMNRAAFEQRLNQDVGDAQENNEISTLCFLDLDQFKIINDTCGHVAGDELLRQLSVQLTSAIRKGDILARIGGDEFAILMTACSLSDAERAANTIRKVVEQFQFMWQEHIFSIGCSIGLAEINASTPNGMEVLKMADAACYAAKDLGRNRIHSYHHDDEQLAKQTGEFLWVNEIKEALADDRFVLYAQAIVSLSDPSAPMIYEVLLRLQTKAGEIIPPGAFLPAAERYNLSGKIDLWVVDHAFEWMANNRDKVDELDHLAINLSGNTLGDEAFVVHIMKQINLHALLPAKIKFEITETAAIANLMNAQAFIHTLQHFGCRFALDDFGSGLSSFAYLKNLPVDALKIDGMFVKDIIDDPIDEAMVKAINEIGHVMGMKTIAEFVENDAIKQRLKEMGVDYAQGYGIGKPQPLTSI